MKRFYSAVASIFLLLTFLSTGAVIIGRVQRQPEVIPGLARCDDVPCYRAIRADQTSWNDALSYLRHTTTAISPNFPGTAPVQGAPGFERYEFQDGSIHLSIATYDIVTISWLTLTFPGANPPKLGDLIATYGVPCAIVYQPTANAIMLKYPYPTAFAIGFTISQPAVLHPDSEVQSITLSGNVSNECSSPYFLSWRGFGVVR